MAETLDPALPDDVHDPADKVLELRIDQDLKLATAESCTGGLLAALLTDVPGRSHVFERGFVVYSNDAKCDLLGIARDDGRDAAARSARRSRSRWRTARCAAREADIALSITGFAGPGRAGRRGRPGPLRLRAPRRRDRASRGALWPYRETGRARRGARSRAGDARSGARGMMTLHRYPLGIHTD